MFKIRGFGPATKQRKTTMRKRLCQINNVVKNDGQVYGFSTDTETGETVFIRQQYIEANDIRPADVGLNFFCYAHKKGPDDEKGPVLITFLGWQDDDESAEVARLRDQLDKALKELAALKSDAKAQPVGPIWTTCARSSDG
jgi:hypothetical protein